MWKFNDIFSLDVHRTSKMLNNVNLQVWKIRLPLKGMGEGGGSFGVPFAASFDTIESRCPDGVETSRERCQF